MRTSDTFTEGEHSVSDQIFVEIETNGGSAMPRRAFDFLSLSLLINPGQG